LFRYKKNMDLYARALEERGIPFEITGSDAFSESEEIHEITNLALALSNPDNPIYTVALLRGVFCGASDEDLVEFKREGGRFNYMSPGLDIVQSKHLGATNVLLGLQRMKTWREWTLEKLEPATNFHGPKFPAGSPKGYFAFYKPGTFQKKGPILSHPAGWEAAAEEEKKYQEAEEQRLMYVAATRARDMLVISTYAGDAKNKPWKTLDAALVGVPELEILPAEMRHAKTIPPPSRAIKTPTPISPLPLAAKDTGEGE
jgi:ATP-dependent exoDNAse (exonuclease V) beta subunit